MGKLDEVLGIAKVTEATVKSISQAQALQAQHIDELYAQTRKLEVEQAKLQAEQEARRDTCETRHPDGAIAQKNKKGIHITVKELFLLIIIIATLAVGGSAGANLLSGG